MAHMINIRKNGMAEMAYVGEKPWHGLGQELKEGASIETWLKAAGMDWAVRASPVRFVGGDGKIHPMNDRVVLYRSDTNAPLGVVSEGYNPVQPGEVLEFFRDLCEGQGFNLETAGVLFGGRRYWAMARINESVRLMGQDEIRGNVLLTTSSDGSKATVAKNCSTRVVCWNTCSMALGEHTPEIRASHRTKFDAANVKKELGLAKDDFHHYTKAAEKMAKQKFTMKDAEKFVAELLNERKDRGEDVKESKSFQKILALFGGEGMGSNLRSAKGTLWGAVNAVTEYVDHHHGARTADAKLGNAWFGKGYDLKSMAMNKGYALAA